MVDPKALSRDQALTLFKTYEDKGWAIKQQMLAIFGLLTPVVFALIAFCAQEYFSGNVTVTTKAAGWTAFWLSLFMSSLVIMSLAHANKDYISSRKVLQHAKIKTLLPTEIIKILPDEKDVKDTLFSYVGWQFFAIMVFTVLLVLFTLLVALVITCQPIG